MYSITHDLRFAARALRRNPGFAGVAVLTLAIGIGANAMVFGLMEATLLRAPAVRSPETLAAVYTACRDGQPRCASSYLDYVDYRDRTAAIDDLAMYKPIELTLGDASGAEFVDAELVTGNYFQLLGVGAALGRVLLPSDDQPGGNPRVAVLSHAFWQSRFGEDPSIVGTPIRINNTPYTVVGVSKASFDGLRLGVAPAVWIPVRAINDLFPPGGFDPFEMRNVRTFNGLVARLGDGVAIERARAELRAVSDQLAMEDPAARGRRTVTVDPLPSYIRPHGREQTIATFVWVFQGVVGFVLLLACANLANLLLARGPSRRRELALRTAIGAGRRRLVRQLLTENLVLSTLGAGAGLLLASLALSVMGAFELPTGFAVAALGAEVNARVAGFAALLALITVMTFGVIPALQGTRGDLTIDLRDIRATGGVRSRRLLRGLVGVQVAVCFLLLVGAGLFLRTLAHQLDTDLGFQPEGVALMELSPGMNGYSGAQSAGLARELIESLNSVPGVEAASAGMRVPVIPDDIGIFVEVDGYTPAPDEEMGVQQNFVAPGYFRALRLPILGGREFSSADVAGSQPVVIINEAMAEAWWPDRDPIGGVVRFMGDAETAYTVIGIAGETAWQGLEMSATPYVYRALFQEEPPGTLRVVARTDPTNLNGLLPLMRGRLREIDPGLAVVDLRTMERAVSSILAPERAGATLLAVFGGLALFLASLGIYGVVAYAVEQRRREFGIRIALGAPIGSLVILVARGMGAPVVLGMFGGLAAALALGPLMRSLLVGVEPSDPVTLVVTTTVLSVAALVAVLVPARRATRADALEVMQAE